MITHKDNPATAFATALKAIMRDPNPNAVRAFMNGVKIGYNMGALDMQVAAALSKHADSEWLNSLND